MSNFWANALGGGRPAAPQTVPAAQPVQQERPWWDSYAPPVEVQQPVYQQPTHVVTQQPSSTRATSARHTATCPNCGSGNYTKGDTTGSMTRCFECGYNPRFDQQAFAAAGGQPTTATRQAASTSTGFHGNITSASQAVAHV